MRIAYISPGAAGMYCGTCIHGNTLAAALIKKGHDVALMPTYTPIRTDEASVSVDQIFFGGINVYLQEKIPLFRHTPRILDRLLNSRPLLNWLAQLGSSTDARDLGALTISVLKGEEGHQNKELAKLIEWLASSYRPDVVHLSLSLFIGFAKEIKRALRVPVFCSVQGEDLFFDELTEPYKSETLELIRNRASDVDGFIATSEYYADYMSDLLRVGRDKFYVVMLGINLADHGIGPGAKSGESFTVGYLARVCPEKGLHILVEAFSQLKQKLGPAKVRLKAAGYLGKKDRAYFDHIQTKVREWGLSSNFEYLGEVDRQQKIAFLSGLDVLSVPTVYREPKGLFVLEALANGVPVVQPRHGSFPELIEATEGGILVQPNSAAALAEGLELLLRDDEYRQELGQRGQIAVHKSFSDEVMADSMLAVYRSHLPHTMTEMQQHERSTVS
ncbi:glycosyltransferase family 4 protein [bacterium]|nr:glycosyltransferase family 4 protein [bacterium]